MNRTETIERVSLLGAIDSRPAITSDQVATIVDSHAIPDSSGRAVLDAAWEPSYDVNAATAEVYRIKAGRVSGDFNFQADNAAFSKGDVLANLLEMEAFYSSRAGSSSGVGNGTAGTMDTGRWGGLPFTDRLGGDLYTNLADRVIP